MPENLASEGNARKINQRFRELEAEIRELRANQQTLENAIGNANGLIQAQTNMIQQVWVARNGTGEV